MRGDVANSPFPGFLRCFSTDGHVDRREEGDEKKNPAGWGVHAVKAGSRCTPGSFETRSC